MAKSKGSSSALGAAGFAPLALALLVGNAVLPPSGGGKAGKGPPANLEGALKPVACGEVENFRDCHRDYATGCSASGKYDGYLNLLKNQLPKPDAKPTKIFTSLSDYAALEQELPDKLAKSNHVDFKDDLSKKGEGHPFGVIGYLYYAKAEGAESSNCQLTGPENIDYHIGIGFDTTVAGKLAAHKSLTAADKAEMKQNAVVVEMTPHYRDLYESDWDVSLLKKVLGSQVKVVGQLLVDNEHYEAKDDCGYKSPGDACWRASVWELHPVTSFQVCTQSDGCKADGPGWVELTEAAAAPAKK